METSAAAQIYGEAHLGWCAHELCLCNPASYTREGGVIHSALYEADDRRHRRGPVKGHRRDYHALGAHFVSWVESGISKHADQLVKLVLVITTK